MVDRAVNWPANCGQCSDILVMHKNNKATVSSGFVVTTQIEFTPHLLRLTDPIARHRMVTQHAIRKSKRI